MLTSPLAAASARVHIEDGQSLAEYSLLLALIAVVCVAVVAVLGLAIAGILGNIAAAL